MKTDIKWIAEDFIKKIWNQKKFDLLGDYLHPGFTDYSLPSSFQQDRDGLRAWVETVGKSFEHETIVEDSVREGDKVMLKISMRLRHIGAWRGIKPEGRFVISAGYRHLHFKEGKIYRHWALINGESIEKQLTAGITDKVY